MKKSFIRKCVSLFIALTFGCNFIIPPSYAQVVSTNLINLPNPGSMIATTPAFAPTAMRGLMIYPDNPLKFDFVIDRGDTKLTEDEFKAESTKLVRYFLASLTVPEKDMWVNLSPYEKNRIIPDNFGQTEMGRDLLAQDYILKQLTASLMYPENETGKAFWNKIYTKINERFGMTDIPLNTFNKVWIIPDKVSIYEHTKGAFIVKGRLKVMLEEDYVALQENRKEKIEDGQDPSSPVHSPSSLTATIQSQMVREIIIPEIEKEVNEGSTFTQLRQIYYSMILASWYKKALKESLLGKVYVDQNKIEGVDIADKNENQKIYEKYIEAFKQGAYDYVKEDYNAQTQEVVTRKYISGGLTFQDANAAIVPPSQSDIKTAVFDMAQHSDITTVALDGRGGVANAAMLAIPADVIEKSIVLDELDNRGLIIDSAMTALKDNSVEKFLQEKLRALKGNLVFDANTFIGEGTVSPQLTHDVLAIFYQTAQQHHQGQFRKDAVNTNYLAHVLGVVSFYVNKLGITNPNAILAAFLHDSLEDSIEYYTTEANKNDSPEQRRKDMKEKVTITREMQEQKALEMKTQIQAQFSAKGIDTQAIGLDLDETFKYILAMSKEKGMDLVNGYFPKLVQQGKEAVALKLADRMYNLGDLRNASNPEFVKGYIFGRDVNDPGTIVEYLEAPMGNSGKSFLESLPSEMNQIKIQFKISVLKAILNNLEKIDGTLAKSAIQRVDKNLLVDPNMSTTDALDKAIQDLEKRDAALTAEETLNPADAAILAEASKSFMVAALAVLLSSTSTGAYTLRGTGEAIKQYEATINKILQPFQQRAERIAMSENQAIDQRISTMQKLIEDYEAKIKEVGSSVDPQVLAALDEFRKSLPDLLKQLENLKFMKEMFNVNSAIDQQLLDAELQKTAGNAGAAKTIYEKILSQQPDIQARAEKGKAVLKEFIMKRTKTTTINGKTTVTQEKISLYDALMVVEAKAQKGLAGLNNKPDQATLGTYELAQQLERTLSNEINKVVPILKRASKN